jgi:hypothetical protein
MVFHFQIGRILKLDKRERHAGKLQNVILYVILIIEENPAVRI